MWRPRPFADPDVPWAGRLPATYKWLSGLSLDRIEQIDRCSQLPLEAPRELRAIAAPLAQFIGPLQRPLPRTTVQLPKRLRWHVPERKWLQIESLAAVAKSVVERRPAGHVLDWCAGKGHLGRAVAVATGRSVCHLELQPALCSAGEALSVRAGIGGETTFIAGSVMDDKHVAGRLGPNTLAIGLHACGVLSSRLVSASVASDVDGIVLSTCCYHKLAPGQQHFKPLSGHCAGHGLSLDRGALRLPTADERNAGTADIRRRRRQLAWRQGVQRLIAETTGDETYRPLGSFRPRDFALSFPKFTSFVFDRLGIVMGRAVGASDERAAWERARRVRGLALLRGLFRRPMECWLILDHALALQEQRYDVEVGSFCRSATTPRNLAIVATARR